MWIIQNDLIIRLPDNAPLPPDSVKFKPSAEFLKDPGSFAVKAGKLAKVEPKPRRTTDHLTIDDVARIKAAIKAGKI